jgi:ElaB/YqjD/DUF883 family membrane-anchored ribosome-binding protein
MNETKYLEQQEAAAHDRIQRALTDDQLGEPPVELIERVTREHPWLAVGGAAALGGVGGALLGRMQAKTLRRVVKWAAVPAWKTLGGSFLG